MVELLLADTGSSVEDDTVAVLLNEPAADGVTTIVTVTEPPFATVPNEHTTVAVPLHEPADDDADTNDTPAGSVSLTCTAAAASGPPLVTVNVYVRFDPATTGSGASPFTIATSACGVAGTGFTVVVVVELLLADTGSSVEDDTVAVLLNEPAADGVTTIVTVTEPPFATVPNEHTTVAVPLHEPADDDADTNDTPAGSVSLTCTAAAASGPPLLTVNVYVRFDPATTGSGASPFTIATSACGVAGTGFTVVVVVELLLADTGSSVEDDTVAVLLNEPAADGVTTIVTVTEPPFATVPNEHTTVAVPLHEPADDDADTNDTPAGSVSLTCTAAAASGPPLLTVNVYVRFDPATTGSGASPFTIATSACGVAGTGFTVVVVVELLLADTGSSVEDDTVAVLLNEPAADGVTTIVTVTEPPFATVPNEHTTVAVPLHEPADDDADTNDTPAGSVSLTCTAAAASGPPLVTVNVYVRFDPATTGSGASPFTIAKSACGVTGSVTVTLAVGPVGEIEPTLAVAPALLK